LANIALDGWQYAGTPGWSPAGAGPPPDIGTLRLLDAAPASRVGGGAGGGCFTIGPFSDPANAEAARTRLAQAGLSSRQRSTSEEEATGYQVLLPPLPSAEEALTTARELAREGIEDYYIIVSDPELRNAVSVGVFQDKAFAERHRAELSRLGFEAEIRVRSRSRTRYWHDFRDPEDQVTGEFVEALAAEQPLQRLERACGEEFAGG
ncbi:MAG: SPOR domain-containing protein, partial [Halofilum sp. (in: g-proteobacteria)]